MLHLDNIILGHVSEQKHLYFAEKGILVYWISINVIYLT